MNPIKSICSRIQRYQFENFEKSKYGKQLCKFKDIHKDEKCFIIGNGPSLSAGDLSVLDENKIKCFAANRIYNVFDKTSWRPNYYASEDEYVLEEIKNKVGKVIDVPKFIPVQRLWYNNIKLSGVLYYKLEAKVINKSEPEFLTDDISTGIPCRGTVTITLAQIAMYMGFKEIYLIGVDHNFSRMTDMAGNLIINENVKDHYGDTKNADENTKGIFNIDEATLSFMDLKEFAEARGVKIYNATRGGKLEVFQRVDFDELF